MDSFPLYVHFVMATIATACFGIYLNCPKTDIPISGFIGGIGWTAYRFFYLSTSEKLFPYFFATMVIGTLASIVSNTNRKPVIIYLIPGVVPLVPGYNMYYTMFYLVTQKYELAMSNFIDSIFIAFAISSGLLFTESIRKIIRNLREKGEKGEVLAEKEELFR